jgi:glycosyltransferase involved in cell wall biosynthesis
VSHRGRLPIPNASDRHELRRRLEQTSLSVGIPAYNEGSGIVHTLQSVCESITTLGLVGVTVILSDSSETTETVDAARFWAERRDVELIVDRSERRRSLKEARNVIMDRARSDLLLQLVGDVVLPAASLFNLLWCLTASPRPEVAVGATAPDPAARGLAYKAAGWQLNATRRHASWLPADAVRAEGACWGAWRSFYGAYRFPLGAGSPLDDACLADYINERNIPTRNCARAVVYKVPAATLRDFFLQTQRAYLGTSPRARTFKEVGAAVVEAAKDPIGAALYLRARLWAAREQRQRPLTPDELWEVSATTKRA